MLCDFKLNPGVFFSVQFVLLGVNTAQFDCSKKAI